MESKIEVRVRIRDSAWPEILARLEEIGFSFFDNISDPEVSELDSLILPGYIPSSSWSSCLRVLGVMSIQRMDDARPRPTHEDLGGRPEKKY